MPKRKRWKKNFNVILGTIIFALLIGTAFSVDWIFGAGFVVGFFLSVWNKILERNFLIPAFIFAGALIIRYSLEFIPGILDAEDYLNLGISLVLFIAILYVGWKIKKGKWRIWKFK